MLFIPLEDDSTTARLIESVLTGGDLSALHLTDSIENYAPSAYSTVLQINDVVIEPIASTIIAIMLVLELARVSSRFEGDRELGIKLVATTLIKSYMLVMVASNSDLILSALNEVGTTVVGGILNLTNVNGAPTRSIVMTQELKDAANNIGMLDAFDVNIMLYIPSLLNTLVSVGIKIIVAFRFFELYILSAFVTLPIVFAAHPDTKSITVGYIRRYGAVLLQTAVIMVSFLVYNAYITAWNQDFGYIPGSSLSEWVFANLSGF